MRSATPWSCGTRLPREIAGEFPDVTLGQGTGRCRDRAHGQPAGSLDTIVATNLHADILSDLAAALAGSLGIAPTGNIDPERRHPSMFEPIHGSAFDIMGKGLANPIGTFWSVVDDARASGRDGCGQAGDAVPSSRHRRCVAAHARSRGHRHDRPGDGGCVRTDRETRRPGPCGGVGAAARPLGGDESAVARDLDARLSLKLLWRIIPFVMLLYFVSFLDRVNVGFAALSMNRALGLSPASFGLGGGLFFIGYVLFEVPSNLILYRVGAPPVDRTGDGHLGIGGGRFGLRRRAQEFLCAEIPAGGGGGRLFPRHHSLPEPVVSVTAAGCRGGVVHGGGAPFHGPRIAAVGRDHAAADGGRTGGLADAVSDGSRTGHPARLRCFAVPDGHAGAGPMALAAGAPPADRRRCSRKPMPGRRRAAIPARSCRRCAIRGCSHWPSSTSAPRRDSTRSACGCR